MLIQLRSTKVLNVDLQYPPAAAAAYFEHGSDIHVYTYWPHALDALQLLQASTHAPSRCMRVLLYRCFLFVSWISFPCVRITCFGGSIYDRMAAAAQWPVPNAEIHAVGRRST